jgi:hypothetical protein
MAYIGREPVTGNFVKLDSITVVNGQAAYTMNNGGSAFTAYDNVNQFLVSLNGILQAPTDSFTVSGSTLTFASNLATGDVIDFVIVLGDTLDIGTPSDNTVTAAKLNDDIISGQTALASEPADTDEFLISDAGTLKRIDYSLIKGGGITEADQWRLASNFTTNNTTINTGWERNDTTGYAKIGTGMSESSGIFTFAATGIYWIHFKANLLSSSDPEYYGIGIETSTDNSTYTQVANSYTSAFAANAHTISACNIFFDVTNTSTHKVRFSTLNADKGTTTVLANSTKNISDVTFLRLGDT